MNQRMTKKMQCAAPAEIGRPRRIIRPLIHAALVGERRDQSEFVNSLASDLHCNSGGPEEDDHMVRVIKVVEDLTEAVERQKAVALNAEKRASEAEKLAEQVTTARRQLETRVAGIAAALDEAAASDPSLAQYAANECFF